MGRRTRSGCVASSSNARSEAGSRPAYIEVSGVKLKPARGAGVCPGAQVSPPKASTAPRRTNNVLTSPRPHGGSADASVDKLGAVNLQVPYGYYRDAALPGATP